MHSALVVNRTALLSLVSLGVLVVSACYRPDTDAMTVKLQEECRVAPAGPACAFEHPEGREYLYERFFLEEVDSPAEEECVLAADCSPNGASDPSVVMRCFRIDDSPLEGFAPRADPDCTLACDIALRDCGDAESCGADVVDRCLDERESCVAACPRF